MSEEIERAARVYRCFERWMRISQHGLGGRMLLVSQTASDSTSLVRAASIAGAGTLMVCEDAGEARALVREEVCDFLVTSLDEALRILKNELRRRQAVAVCLQAGVVETLQACRERGVQPEFVTEPEPTLAARGARLVSYSVDAESQEEDIAQFVSWRAAAGSRRAMASLDALALAALGPLDRLERQLWLERSPQFLGRALNKCRVLPMEPGEASRFVTAVRHSIAADDALTGVRVWLGDDVLL